MTIGFRRGVGSLLALAWLGLRRKPRSSTTPSSILLLLTLAAAARADPLGDCAALLPGGVAPVYATAPAHHTELCHAPAFWLSHDDDAHEPRLVAWVVSAEHLKLPHIARTDDFRPDVALPCVLWNKPTNSGRPACLRTTSARPSDYAGSGYDQGHMSDAEDNGWSEATEHLSFLMSNMIPQCPTCNRQTWRYIENWTRKLTATHPLLYVMSGPVLSGLDDQQPMLIGKDGVNVPIASWKLVIDPAGNQAWGFIVTNDPAGLQPGADISLYVVAPRTVEEAAQMTLPIPAGIDRDKSAPLN